MDKLLENQTGLTKRTGIKGNFFRIKTNSNFKYIVTQALYFPGQPY